MPSPPISELPTCLSKTRKIDNSAGGGADQKPSAFYWPGSHLETACCRSGGCSDTHSPEFWPKAQTSLQTSRISSPATIKADIFFAHLVSSSDLTHRHYTLKSNLATNDPFLRKKVAPAAHFSPELFRSDLRQLPPAFSRYFDHQFGGAGIPVAVAGADADEMLPGGKLRCRNPVFLPG